MAINAVSQVGPSFGDSVWWGKEAQKKWHSHLITPWFHGPEQLSEWNTCLGCFLCLIYPFYGPQNWWNIVLLQCRAYLYSFLLMKYILALINMCSRDDKPHFGPFLTQYIHFMQFHIPSQGPDEVHMFYFVQTSVRSTQIHLYKPRYSLYCLENVCSYSPLVHFRLIVSPKENNVPEAQGRCLFRHIPPRIGDIHFDRLCILVWMCTVGWRMCYSWHYWYLSLN